MSPPTRAQLLQAATSFCAAFARGEGPEALLSHFSSSAPDPRLLALEHGLPSLAPFLGRPFRGRAGVRRYFETVAGCLRFEGMRFPPANASGEGEGDRDGEGDGEGFVVDAEARRVCARGGAEFEWLATGRRWRETFVYVLAFDDECRVVTYEVWADTGAAYLARRGELGEGEGAGA